MASAGRDLGSPGLRYWLRTGLPVRASMAGTSRKSNAAGVATTWTVQPCSWASLMSGATGDVLGGDHVGGTERQVGPFVPAALQERAGGVHEEGCLPLGDFDPA